MMNSLYSKVRHKVLRTNGKHHSKPEQMSPTIGTNRKSQPGDHPECRGIRSPFAVFHCSYKYFMKILLDYSAE